MNKAFEIVNENTEFRTKLEQLAEEACELSQAALKVIRAFELSENPTPIRSDTAWEQLIEEVDDVMMILDLLRIQHGCSENNPKWKRWADRIENKRLVIIDDVP